MYAADHRDVMAEFGAPLESLPDFEFDPNTMTATFTESGEHREVGGLLPKRETSRLEGLGGKLDDQLAKAAAYAIEALYNSGRVKRLSFNRNLLSYMVPVSKSGFIYTRTWKEVFKQSIKERSIFRLFDVRITVCPHGGFGDFKPHHNLQVSVTFNHYTPGPRRSFWVVFNAQHNTPFQVGVGNNPPTPRYS